MKTDNHSKNKSIPVPKSTKSISTVHQRRTTNNPKSVSQPMPGSTPVSMMMIHSKILIAKTE